MWGNAGVRVSATAYQGWRASIRVCALARCQEGVRQVLQQFPHFEDLVERTVGLSEQTLIYCNQNLCFEIS
jgi:hypothetical protein